MARNRANWKYPRQVVLTVSTEVEAAMARIADEQGLTRTEVIRVLLHDGLRRAGYHVATKDKREPVLNDIKASKGPAVTK